MTIAYFDCFAGASGDMILGALVDAGVDLDSLRDKLAQLAIPNWELRAEKVSTRGIAATRVQVIARDDAAGRPFSELDAMIASSGVDGEVQAIARKIMRRLAEVEARLHNERIEDIHLHELGGVDTVIDVVGAVVALKMLNAEQVYVSTFPMGHGTVNTRHGTLPLPAPAVAELVIGAPIRAMDIAAELVTPTGAAILTTLAQGYATFPPMKLERVGYGAGARDLPIPNFLRVLIGQTGSENDAMVETLTLIETNVDDANPQIYDYLEYKLFQAGALDVWLTPIQMKKNRPATLLSLLCRVSDADAMMRILFEEGVTLGVRRREVERYALARQVIAVETPYGSVRVKIAQTGGRVVRLAPEYEDCRKRAEEHRVSLVEIYHAAEIAAREKLND